MSLFDTQEIMTNAIISDAKEKIKHLTRGLMISDILVNFHYGEPYVVTLPLPDAEQMIVVNMFWKDKKADVEVEYSADMDGIYGFDKMFELKQEIKNLCVTILNYYLLVPYKEKNEPSSYREVSF